jgi:hypothetical protein
MRIYEAFGPGDYEEGRGPSVSYGLYVNEQDAWDFVNPREGVMGCHPSKGNVYPMTKMDVGDVSRITNWQQYADHFGRWGHWFVVDRDVR